jgi:hypothetical protein
LTSLRHSWVRLLHRLIEPLAGGDGGLLGELLTSVSLGQGGGGSKQLSRFVQTTGALFAEDQLLLVTLGQQQAELGEEEDEVNLLKFRRYFCRSVSYLSKDKINFIGFFLFGNYKASY